MSLNISKYLRLFYTPLIMAAFIAAPTAIAKDYLVKSQKDYRKAAKKLKAGDSLILKDGEWKDFQIIFEGEGTAEDKITLRAETPGGVMLTGQSNLRIGGAYLNVSGLVFKDGYSPTRDVIDMRSPNYRGAAFLEISDIVIDGYNKPGTDEKDYWIDFRGVRNRLTRSALLNKTSLGSTVITTQELDNKHPGGHVIAENYFGPRPELGKNGGETIRIGVGKVSHQRFEMRVENNYFEDASGEAEIISIKSHGNIIRNNMFVESQGAVTFRQGDDNLVTRNVFLGNGVKATGGVRLTSFNNTVTDNYFEGLAGDGGRSALTFMNGLSDKAAPLALYKQVQNARVENNSFINSHAMTFGVRHRKDKGAQTYVPVDSVIAHNIMANTSGAPLQAVSLDDMSGLRFEGNLGKVKGVQDLNIISAPLNAPLIKADNGLYYPQNSDVGAPLDLKPFSRDDVGPSYFVKPQR